MVQSLRRASESKLIAGVLGPVASDPGIETPTGTRFVDADQIGPIFSAVRCSATEHASEERASYGFRPSGWRGDRISANRLPITIASFWFLVWRRPSVV